MHNFLISVVNCEYPILSDSLLICLPVFCANIHLPFLFLFSFNAVIVCIWKRSWNSLYVNARVDDEISAQCVCCQFRRLTYMYILKQMSFKSVVIFNASDLNFPLNPCYFSFTTHSAKRYSTHRRRRSHKNFIMCTIYINKHPPYPSQWTQCAIQSVWKTGPNVTWV